MNTTNQLIIDCLARVLRINQTTDAELTFSISHVSSIRCFGYKNGYANLVNEVGESPDPDFEPLDGDSIFLRFDGAEEILRKLLASLDVLEKELINAK